MHKSPAPILRVLGVSGPSSAVSSALAAGPSIPDVHRASPEIEGQQSDGIRMDLATPRDISTIMPSILARLNNIMSRLPPSNDEAPPRYEEHQEIHASARRVRPRK